MGLLVRLESEDGAPIEEVADSGNLLAYLLPEIRDSSFPMLRFVDPYGDTVFNRLQLGSFVEEIERIQKKAETEEERNLLKRIHSLAAHGLKEVGLYLKFYGD